MANEAFALSPISARAAQPSEEDYDAISQAFMETSRGRWFLGEYAKRNRNADTRMVLDAVARIEEGLAAQRQPQPAAEDALAEALAAVRSAVDEAREASVAALDGLALEDKLAPVRKGARIIREISWRWREIGADARICDLLDSQVVAIEGACGQIASIDPLTPLSAAFDLIEERISGFGDGDDIAPIQPPEAAATSSSPAPSDVMATAEVASATDAAEAAIAISAVQVDEVAATADAVDITAEAVEMTAEAVDATAEAGDATAEADEAHDEAILDMIALEMAAPDPSESDNSFDMDVGEPHVAELPPTESSIVADEPVPMAAATEPQAIGPSLPPSPDPPVEPAPNPAAEPSLGSSLIASGILQRPRTAESDPLAPIRRMSQIEKIAFFS